MVRQFFFKHEGAVPLFFHHPPLWIASSSIDSVVASVIVEIIF
jgi:fructose-specific phosphotransferase system IIC component